MMVAVAVAVARCMPFGSDIVSSAAVGILVRSRIGIGRKASGFEKLVLSDKIVLARS